MRVPRALTIATSDSGGAAGIQADLKAFAAAGVYGMSALVALTAQNTVAVTAIHELPPEFVVAELDAVFSDLGVDAAKTGMLFSRRLIETVAGYLETHPVPLVVDPVMVASSGAKLLEDDAVEALVRLLFPLATVVTPNLPEAVALAGFTGERRDLAERLHELGAAAVLVTGGHGEHPVDHLFDGTRHIEIPVIRHPVACNSRRRLHPLCDPRRLPRPRRAPRSRRARRRRRRLRRGRSRPPGARLRRRPRRHLQPERTHVSPIDPAPPSAHPRPWVGTHPSALEINSTPAARPCLCRNCNGSSTGGGAE